MNIPDLKQYSAKQIWLTISGIIFLISSMWGVVQAAAAVDERYVHQTSFDERMDKMRIRQLEDEIFKLEFKVADGTATPLDKALLQRYKSELQSLRR